MTKVDTNVEVGKQDDDDTKETDFKEWIQDDDETKEALEKNNIKYTFQTVKVESIVQNVTINQDDMNKTEIGNDEHGENFSTFMRQQHDKIKNFVCDTCPNSFWKNSHLRQHQKSVHSLERNFTCLICSKGCVSKGELVTHMKCHTKERSFKCDVCIETFITNSCLKAHKRKHDGTMLQCQDCGKQFSKAQHLNVHIKFVHLKASTALRSKRRRELKLLKGHNSLSLATENDLKYLKEKTNENQMDMEKGQTTQMCTICGMLFKKLSKKKIHMLTHYAVFKNLNIDNNFVWSEDRTLMSCMDCGKKFTQHGHMKVHIALVHYQLQNKDNLDNFNISDIDQSVVTLKTEKKKTYKKEYKKGECQECGKTYYKRHLKEHLLNVHARKSDLKTDENQPEETFLNFATQLNSEFSGPELVLALRYVQDIKESSNTEKLTKVMEDSQNKSYRKVFEGLGVLGTENNIKIKHDSRKETFPKLTRGHREKVKKQEYLEHDDAVSILIDGSPTYSMEEPESPLFSEGAKSEHWGEEKKFSKAMKKNSLNKKGKKQNKMEKIGSSTNIAKESKTCSICNKVFEKVSKKKYHMLRHTKLFKNLSIDDKIYRSEDRTLLSCIDCGKEFKQFSHIKMHVARVHNQLHRLENLNNLNSSEFLETLKKSGNDEKNTSQPVKKEMIKDKEGPNSNPKEFLYCEFCMKQFARKEGLTRHKYFKHEGLGYNCDKCDYAARTPLGLLKHKSSKHGIDSKVIPDDVILSASQCKECGKLYNNKTGLRRHEMVHTGERPFPCMKCDKKFRQKSTLDGHQKIHDKM